ncbi:TSG101 [Lepeophtheirus salmonis]|uniref:TSG101 n=1 Tax=Lepeophtheirus salmonis TaxID=72036 RepID=A0A7R8H6U8_LEPSM|nr:TSG101 [Lepeophtheirus salmonis]CAF2903926.1 TSG101 [Lepeophtheirus salmonis]
MKYKKYDKFLSKATNNYRYSDCIKKDVRYVLNSYPGLSPELDNFVFNDGSEKKLLNLKGTIPVKYKGASYNIPVCFWLPEDYPHNPPMAFVKPTPDMEIKVSEKVDSDGKISLRILTTWKEDPEASKSDSRPNSTKSFMKTRAEIDSLHETTKDLLDSQEALSKHLTELQELSKVSDSQQETLTTLRTKFRNSIDSLTSLLHSGINPDEIIHPQYPLQQQILCAYVEDASADDSIFFLGEALRRGRIDLEVYLKRVRQISRKQFMSRVIIERCRRQMGLLEISKS